MIENLIVSLQSYKTQMEYQNVDFDGDRPAQYSWLRDEMSKLYKEDTSIFGPTSPTAPSASWSTMSKKEKEAYTKQNKSESELVKKGYARVREKVKEIRQSFSQAVINGKRSGSGKIVYEFYDELIKIWGGAAATKPLSFGVNTETLNDDLESCKDDQLQQDDQSFLPGEDEIFGSDEDENDELFAAGKKSELLSDEESQSKDGRKRKIVNQVPKLIDNKRKHLEKTLSAAQRDGLLLNEAKEESKFRKDLADATREATSCFSKALKDVSSSMAQVGCGLSRSIEMMAQAVMAQTMNNTLATAQSAPYNQNHFYQNCVPNVYPAPVSHQVTAQHIQPNAQQQIGTPNLIQQDYQPNKGNGEENVYHQL